MAKHHLIQAAEVTCSKAISDAKAQTTSQAAMFQEEHYNYPQSLEEQALREESRHCHDILSSCQATYATVHIQLGGTGCILSFTIGANTSITLTCSAPRDPSHGRTDILSRSSHDDAQTVSETEKVPSFARVNGGHAPGQSYPGSCNGRTSSP